MHWNELTSIEQLDLIEAQSEVQPVLIFKHSTRCSISRFALKQFEFEFDLQEAILPYYLDLLNFREVSNEIANRFSVQHQSPQILVLNNREVVYYASHEGIAVSELRKKVYKKSI
jgi:bacillithiol system protein YtxJ